MSPGLQAPFGARSFILDQSYSVPFDLIAHPLRLEFGTATDTELLPRTLSASSGLPGSVLLRGVGPLLWIDRDLVFEQFDRKSIRDAGDSHLTTGAIPTT